ncbi:histidinol-phosphate transaminase [Sporosarcina sp. ACRSL]|uniref:histidinol-phosphate transaminase n=1 Tax=Sporosarcina sp. ACRSL TaxID=2918215 RepID=UPI001EF4BB96|nr:histidinol-phosphate transaminase [Sporosarcina sp. ACRSL]MCG7344549.1 histidinol-phosphate transaminase [Sporosarcina sp. ACRSL]
MSKFWSEMVKRTEPYVPGEQLNDRDIIKLNTNENPYPPSPLVKEAILKQLEGQLRLYPSPTVDELRRVIAETNGISAEQVFVGNGSDEVLAFSFMAFFNPGKPIRFPAITYSFYPVYAKLFNIPYETIEVNEDFTLPAKPFFGADGGVILPNPNAPTSLYMDLSWVESVVVNNPDTVVIIDEAYIDFAPESAVQLVKSHENLLVVQTTSKSRSLAGMRVGYAIGHPALIEALIRIKDSFNSYTIDRLAIAGATAAFKDQKYFDETVLKIKETRERLTEALKELGFNVLPSQTNFVFASHSNMRAVDLYTKLKDEGILVRHFNQSGIDNYFRITIGTDEQMDSLLKKLEWILAGEN